MKIALIGQAAFGEAVLKALRERGEEIVGVCAPATPEGGRPDPLRATAEGAGLPVVPTRQLRRDEAVLKQYLDWKADLNVMAFVTDIIPESVLFAPKLQTIQYHPSLLPLHRGASAIAWAIIMGDEKTGLSIFWPDKGIDTGPILLQKEVDVAADDTVTTLYFNKLFQLGVDAMVESVALVKQGQAPRVEQDHAKATYEPILKDEHTWIDWSLEPAKLYALIRGANPSPGANTKLRGAGLKILDSALSTGGPAGLPGQIVGVGDQGLTVALASGTLLIKRVQVPGGPKTAAVEWARGTGVASGDRFEGK